MFRNTVFHTPILLIVFNRPQTAQQVFDRIKQIQPKYLFVAADGPRPERPEDIQKCADTRKIIEQIDWDCELKTLFREENRGCGYGPAEAITWFFKHVEEGIILEDDCIPSLSFFQFCQELLKCYRDAEDIYMISGTNVFHKWKYFHRSYIFTYLGQSLGWASWRRAWEKFDYKMILWGTEAGKKNVEKSIKNRYFFEYYKKSLDEVYNKTPEDVWDFQWLFARWVNGGKTIVPTVNLITNIGFNQDASHSFYEKDIRANIPAFEMNFPLKHNKKRIDRLFDWITFQKIVNPEKKPIFRRFILKAFMLFYSKLRFK